MSSETLISHKVLRLQEQLIDNGLIQLTIAPERTDSHTADRRNDARTLFVRIADMRDNGSAAERNVAQEPIVKALRLAAQDIIQTGGQIAGSLVSALDNNANEKHYLALPFNAQGDSQNYDYYVQQSAAYRELSHFARAHNLAAGIAPTVNQQKTR